MPTRQAQAGEAEVVRVTTRAQWRAWLARHHAQPDWIWLQFPKKTSPDFADLTYDALVEEALDAIEALEVPDDLAAALGRNAAARRHFDSFRPGSRKLILTWIGTAKRPDTRAARRRVGASCRARPARQPPRGARAIAAAYS